MSAKTGEFVTAIGAISGTSMDGIDVALIRSDGRSRVETGPGATFPYPAEVSAALRDVIRDPQRALGPLEALEAAVTDAHVAAIEAFLLRFAVDRRAVTLVGMHGQTVLHRPRERFTRQLCDGRRAATALRIDVVNDFRAADVAAGGEGAPLVPLYHAAMSATLERPLTLLNWGGVGNVTYLGADGEIVAFDTGPANALIDDFVARRRGLSHDEGGALAAAGKADQALVANFMSDAFFERPLMILNWGGVGNVTYLGAGGEIIAFDTGPANALIDDFVRRRRGLSHDEGGALAAAGRVDQAALAALMSDPYFDAPPPKSLDRNHFHALAREVERLGDADGAATLAAFTIEATAAALRHFGDEPQRWLVCGGGRRNLTLMQALGARLGVRIEPIEAIGYDGDVIEAQCFAYLALRSRRGLPLSLPTTTGAPRPMPGGVFWPAPKAA